MKSAEIQRYLVHGTTKATDSVLTGDCRQRTFPNEEGSAAAILRIVFSVIGIARLTTTWTCTVVSSVDDLGGWSVFGVHRVHLYYRSWILCWVTEHWSVSICGEKCSDIL